MLGLGPLKLAWAEKFKDIRLLPRYPWLSNGLCYARVAVRQYGVHTDAFRARILLAPLPFVYGPRTVPVSVAEPWIALGDEVLAQTIKATLLDTKLNSTALANEHTKLGAALVSYSICLIIRALGEWIQGDFVDLSNLDSESMLRYDKIYEHFLGLITAFKWDRPADWLSFSESVQITTSESVI
ncbi:hypothetical protein HGRIS_001579 [Hohenbuehelia grisea]|uniref:Uncharacterized protein n=1 Tax=Hohenbuehelia grisea TaxID=104357 RepID=A0ABR3JQN8_9AGAR